ncbi:alpha/beta fold hydrolase [Sphingomonas sp.]|uniref:alpha/beta fold hydrolase n=1 Tax=Sphingomonas sp. TaxID=28214 RepID=UPI0025FB05D1|nr:alpha/beta fold hydrolase [Sphingomonas sp.]
MKWDRTPLAPVKGRPSPDDQAPSAWDGWRQVAWHIPRMLSGLGPLGPRGPEDGPPALVIPGFLANDRTTMELRRGLARAGWRAHPWLLGKNLGAKIDTMILLESRLQAIYDGGAEPVRGTGEHGHHRRQPVLIVGWSLGGLFARELACRVPHMVRAVVTLGTPFSGNLKTNTNVREFYERVAGHDVNEPPFPRIGSKPPVPTLALWSRKDGIVAPAAARGLAHEVDKAVEIDTHHMGFAVYRPALSEVMREIAIFLTEQEGAAPSLKPASAA